MSSYSNIVNAMMSWNPLSVYSQYCLFLLLTLNTIHYSAPKKIKKLKLKLSTIHQSWNSIRPMVICGFTLHMM